MNKKEFFIGLACGIGIVSLFGSIMYHNTAFVDLNDFIGDDPSGSKNGFTTQDYACEKQCYEAHKECIKNVVKTTKPGSKKFFEGMNLCDETLSKCRQNCLEKDQGGELTEEQKNEIALNECIKNAKNELQICLNDLPKFTSMKNFQKLYAECMGQFIQAVNQCKEKFQ